MNIFIVEKSTLEAIKHLSNPTKNYFNNSLVEYQKITNTEDYNLFFYKIEVHSGTTILEIFEKYQEKYQERTGEKLDRKQYEYGIERLLAKQSSFNTIIYRKIEKLQENIDELNILEDEILIISKYEKNSNYIQPRFSRRFFDCKNTADFFERVKNDICTSTFSLSLVLLYTDADKELTYFIREFHHELDILSGYYMMVYAIEKVKTFENNSEIINYWKTLLSEKLYIILSILGKVNSKPYDKTKCYQIGKQLGVSPSQFPTMVIFDSPNPETSIILPITKPYIKCFRTIFHEVKEIMDKVIKEEEEKLKEEEEKLKEKLKDKEEFRKNLEQRFLSKNLTYSTNTKINIKSNIIKDNYKKIRANIIQNNNIKNIIDTSYKFKHGNIMIQNRNLNISGNATVHANGAGAFNLGDISGNVGNTINELPDFDDEPNKKELKDLLNQLQTAVLETDLDDEDKEQTLEQVEVIAKALSDKQNTKFKRKAKSAMGIIQDIASALPPTTRMITICNQLPNLIRKIF